MIGESQFMSCALLLACPIWCVRAVHKVESSGTGFYPGTDKITLKFEGHVFHAYTHGKFDQSHPTLSYSKWTEKYSEFGATGAYKRFNAAFALDKKAAMFASSWGAFQIMGENYSECGYRSVDDFVSALQTAESNHLNAFAKYVQSRKLQRFLVDLTRPSNAAGFAYRYNGAQYQKNDYDGKLMRAANYYKNLYK